MRTRRSGIRIEKKLPNCFLWFSISHIQSWRAGRAEQNIFILLLQYNHKTLLPPFFSSQGETLLPSPQSCKKQNLRMEMGIFQYQHFSSQTESSRNREQDKSVVHIRHNMQFSRDSVPTCCIFHDTIFPFFLCAFLAKQGKNQPQQRCICRKAHSLLHNEKQETFPSIKLLSNINLENVMWRNAVYNTFSQS